MKWSDLNYEQGMLEDSIKNARECNDFLQLLEALKADEQVAFVIKMNIIHVTFMDLKLIIINCNNCSRLPQLSVPRGMAITNIYDVNIKKKYNASSMELIAELNDNGQNYKLWERSLSQIKQLVSEVHQWKTPRPEPALRHLLLRRFNNTNGDLIVLNAGYFFRTTNIRYGCKRFADIIAIYRVEDKWKVIVVSVQIGIIEMDNLESMHRKIVDLEQLYRYRRESLKQTARNLVSARYHLGLLVGETEPLIVDDDDIKWSMVCYIEGEAMRDEINDNAEVHRQRTRDKEYHDEWSKNFYFNIVDVNDTNVWSIEGLTKSRIL